MGIDQNKVLIDGPTTGVSRQASRLKVTFPFNSSTKVVRGQLESAKIAETWASSNWAKRLATREIRANLSDFDRFKLRKAKAQRNKILSVALNGKKKALRKAGKL